MAPWVKPPFDPAVADGERGTPAGLNFETLLCKGCSAQSTAANPKLATHTLLCVSSVIPNPAPSSPPPENGEPCAYRPVGVNFSSSLPPQTGASGLRL